MTKYNELLREVRDERKDYLRDALDAVVTEARDHSNPENEIHGLVSNWRLTSPEHDAIVDEAKRIVSNEAIAFKSPKLSTKYESILNRVSSTKAQFINKVLKGLVDAAKASTNPNQALQQAAQDFILSNAEQQAIIEQANINLQMLQTQQQTHQTLHNL